MSQRREHCVRKELDEEVQRRDRRTGHRTIERSERDGSRRQFAPLARMFARPFVGALEGHVAGVEALARRPDSLADVASAGADGGTSLLLPWCGEADGCRADIV